MKLSQKARTPLPMACNLLETSVTQAYLATRMDNKEERGNQKEGKGQSEETFICLINYALNY